MSLFRESYLKKLRANLIKESGRDISDKDWDNVIEKVEKPIIEDLKKELPKAFLFSMFKIAEKGDVIFEIDGVDIGAEIRRLRRIYEWLEQKKLYFGW